jgi:hypothetical protein
MESDNDKDAEDDNEEVAAGEEDATPNLFQNHMQVEENLAEIQLFASQNGYPREFANASKVGKEVYWMQLGVITMLRIYRLGQQAQPLQPVE